MTTANMVNIITNVTLKYLNVTRDDIEKPQTSGENVTEARAIIAKISYSYSLPISAVRRVLNRDEDHTIYYLMHEVNEETLYEIKKQVVYYIQELENPEANKEEEKKEKKD